MQQTRTVVVVGAGLMGTGIVHAFAVNDCRVRLIETNRNAAEKAVAQIHRLLDDGVKLGKLDEAAREAAQRRITLAERIDADATAGAELLLETATEKLDVKREILRQADELLSPDALIATNTSALSISELASFTKRPQRVVGMHFFNPVHKMKLVEIIRGVETTPETIERARQWAKSLQKTSIVVNEAPGFTTSRMSAMMGNEAMYMLAEGVASAEDVDTAMRLAFNHPMGPLELGDLTGWDTRLAVLQYLHQSLGEKFRPCPLITKMVKAGRLGRKVGRGIYDYDAQGNKVPGSGLKVFS
jgi:3-hydroxybutyryl-CoA dehydrogenase